MQDDSDAFVGDFVDEPKGWMTDAAAEGQRIQDEILRKMTPARKLELAMDLYWSARELKAAGLRSQHPDWSEEQVQAAVKEIFMYARS